MVENIGDFGDDRVLAFCVHCGNETDTRDHVPSKVFLDEPYPENLPVIFSCDRCNNALSKNEDYVACLIECVKMGSVNWEEMERQKIGGVLKHSPALTTRLANTIGKTKTTDVFNIEKHRISTVLLKLARGHAAYELHELHLEQPSSLTYVPLHLLTDESRQWFEESPKVSLLPEVGSRSLQRIVQSSMMLPQWEIVQKNRYRYLTIHGTQIIIRAVISEYLAFEVIWES
jgi:hypothetical protein